ncbi:translation initiation factor eIF4A [Tulasnella sp. 417]|nr:translation initiation factor eIF4A [Tulasnella sp. 417]
MGLKPELLRGIYAYGFERLSTIQQRVIVPVIKGRDVIVHAQAETGKTVTLSIPILQKLDTSIKGTQALILVPTRELAQEIQKIVIALGDYLQVDCHACIGGTNVREDFKRTDHIKIFCLDEADEMLAPGFRKQIDDIFQRLPQETQVVLLSATMPDDILEATKRLMRDPVRIVIKREGLSFEGIKQFYITVEKEERKLNTLCDLYEKVTITQAVVFCNTRRKVDWLTEKLTSRELVVSAMHGGMDPRQREVLMKEFRSGSSRVFITTGQFTRSINVQQVSFVINYDLPTDCENYLRRIGRGGQVERKGVVVNFVTAADVEMLREIERSYNTQIKEMPPNTAYVVSKSFLLVPVD